MATKNDLIEAQNFSRRRLLTAFVSGAPGGKELVPAAPLRAVIAAIALTAAVLLAGVFYGLNQPGLPSGWENGRMVVAKDTGGRYVTIDGVLHPVLNTSSARLLIPSSDFAIITTDQKTLDKHKLGSTVGIVGAPDELPARSSLVNNGWTACATTGGGTDVSINRQQAASATDDAAVVQSGGTRYVIQGTHRFAVDNANSDAILRAAGFASLNPASVSAAWLNLYTPGTALKPLTIDDAGLPLSGTSLTIGAVVHFDGQPTGQRYVVQTDGKLASLSPLAWQLLQLGNAHVADTVVNLPSTATRSLRTTTTPFGGDDWPNNTFTPMGTADRPCAMLTHRQGVATTVLGTQSTDHVSTNRVQVQSGHGSLVYAGGSGTQNSRILTLIDGTGTAYGIPGATTETIKRLGYTTSNVGTVDHSWIRLFGSGPSLTTKAAQKTHAAETQ